jgi:rhamnosyl/mannosyltransferase
MCGGTGAHSVVTYQSDIVRQKHLMRAYRPLMRRFLGAADAVVATSPNYVATSPILGELRRAIDVVPNGIDEDALPPVDPRRVGRWEQELGRGFFLFVGVLRYYKGIHVLLQAAREVTRPVVIVGAGPEMERLQATAAQLGLSHVHFVGEVSDADKVALYTLADAFVFPSNLRSEAFGMSLAEAALFGKPMISCEIGTGTTFINLDGVTGLSVPPDDPQALARAMRQLAGDPVAVARMGAAARERYEALFTARRMAQAYLDIYQRLVPGRVPGPATLARDAVTA